MTISYHEDLAYTLDDRHMALIALVDPDTRTPEEIAEGVAAGRPQASLRQEVARLDLPRLTPVLATIDLVQAERGGDLDVWQVIDAYDAGRGVAVGLCVCEEPAALAA